LAGFAGLLVAPRLSRGQARSKIPRIGILWFGSVDIGATASLRSVLLQRLAALGYVEGKTVVIEERFAKGNADRLGELARELVASKVDVIVTPAVTASRAARQATSTIPIVMVRRRRSG
jgi:putative ABC transport system substrate-binding protein